jgi:hypothetical protein
MTRYRLHRFHILLQQKGDSEEEESVPTRAPPNGLRGGKHADNNREELDASNLMDVQEAAKKFRKAERRRGAFILHRVHTAYCVLTMMPLAHDRETAVNLCISILLTTFTNVTYAITLSWNASPATTSRT